MGTPDPGNQWPGLCSKVALMTVHAQTTSQGAQRHEAGRAGTAGLRRNAAATGQRILIIEDDPRCADALSALLEQAGHVVAVAHDGTVGLDRARTFAPDVIVCDIGLPGALDGHGVALAVRADPVLHAVRMIALTGSKRPENENLARGCGFDAYLTKPAKLEVLSRLLAHMPAGEA